MIAPVEEHLEKERLVIVPDGKLHLLPFDALIDEADEPLLKTHVVSYVPSATVLHLLRHSEQPTSDLPLLAIGDVQYGSSDQTLLASQIDPTEQTRGMFDIAGARLTELPSTAEEVASVAEAAGESAGRLEGQAEKGSVPFPPLFPLLFPPPFSSFSSGSPSPSLAPTQRPNPPRRALTAHLVREAG